MSIEKYEFFDNLRSPATGISDLDFRAARYMLRPFTLHSKEFYEYWNETKEMLKKLFQTRNEVIKITGSIRVAFDAIISNIIEPGDKVLVLSNGYWGSYVARVVKSYKGIPILYEESPTRAFDPKKVEKVIEKHKDLKAVSIMHVETDTGTVHPVNEIGKIVKDKTNALYIVDCATSLGGMEVKTDEWEADFCFTGSHKCLSAPVGLAFVAVSDKGWNAIEKRKTPILGTYNNLLPWRKPLPDECEPPIPVCILHAVRARLDYIFRHGPEIIFKRHEIAAKAFRFGLIEMGLELLSESPESPPCSNVVTVFKIPKVVDEEKLSKMMCERYNVWFGASPYRKGVFQLGTINDSQVNPRHILYYITSLGLALSELGVKVRLEEAIKKADKILADLETFK